MPWIGSPRRDRLQQAAAMAADQDGVLSRRQVHELGLDRRDIRTQVDAGRWHKPSPYTVALFTGELSQRQQWWRALLETGCLRGALDGATALQAAGLIGYTAPTTISCPLGAKPRRMAHAEVHVTRWRFTADQMNTGIPRVRPDAAAIRGALWARTDRQAALLLVMTVQQRLSTARRLQWELTRIRRHPRRRLLVRVLADIADGAQALGELDFTALCRQHHLPKPSRQVLRQGPRGRIYLDVYFDEYSLVVEIAASSTPPASGGWTMRCGRTR